MRRLLYAGLPFLFLAAALCAVHAGDRLNHVFDISRDARNSLSSKSMAALDLLPHALEVIAVVPEETAVRAGIAEFFLRYQRYKPDLRLSFLDPRRDPDGAQARGARLGEVLLEFDGRSERLTRLDESATTNALARLARGDERWITFLANNGERRVEREANHDLSRFAEYLERRGLHVREYVLGQTDAIPSNTAVLVLASPTVAYVPSEIDEINRYVAAGGNLLWLTEPDAPAALAPLERALGFERFPGTIVDPIGLAKFKNPAYAISLEQIDHALMADFNQTLAFPFAAALVAKPNLDWHAAILAQTGDEAWTETGPFTGNVGFDAPDEVQGSLALAIALTKARKHGEQRIVVIGDGDFLANSFVDNLGNSEFGRRLLDWLCADDALIDIAVAEVADAVLTLEMWQRLTIFLFFGVVLPVTLAINGGVRWWRRRHA